MYGYGTNINLQYQNGIQQYHVNVGSLFCHTYLDLYRLGNRVIMELVA